jgi:hypothetical protein
MDWDMNQEFLAESEEQSDSVSVSENENDDNDDENDDNFNIPTPLVDWYDESDSGECDDDDDDDDDGRSTFPVHNSSSVDDCNAHGVIHVRILRARNLPCPVGSSVGVSVSLPPYKGKIKSTRTKAIIPSTTSLDHGVCVEWERERRIIKPYKNNNDGSQYFENDDDDDDDDNYDDNDNDNDKNLLSMVNGWSGPNSPVPSIRIDVTFSPLGLGLFDFTMASVELSSTVLMQRPGVWRKRWCAMEVSSSSTSQTNYHHNHNDDPFIRIQAVFVPSISDDDDDDDVRTQTAAPTTIPPKQFITVPPPPSPPPPPRTLLIENKAADANDDTIEEQDDSNDYSNNIQPPPPPPPPPPPRTLLIENEAVANDDKIEEQDDSSNDDSINIQPEHQPNDVQTITSSEELNDNHHIHHDHRQQSNTHEETKMNNNKDNDDHYIVPLNSKEEDTSLFWNSQELSLPGEVASSNGDASTVFSRKTTASQKAARDAASLRCPHLLRAQTYWAPSNCAVCSKILIGIFKNGVGFRCEVCNIDCCSDCRLHVDLRVPCGSDLASEIVEASFRNKLSPSGLISIVAPDEVYLEKQRSLLEEDESMHRGRLNSTSSIITSRQSTYSNGPHSPLSSSAAELNTIEGIGRCRFDVTTACLFLQNVSSWNDNNDESNELPALRKGDYYVRISTSDSDKSARTPTLQKTGGMPHFRSAQMKFSLSHYGVQFRIDVVEADTDTIVGSALLTTQGILQTQRDSYIAEHGVSLIQFLKGPIPWMGKRKMKIKLRSGIKGGASTDEFFSLPPPKSNGIASKTSAAEKTGAISGWIDISVGVEEFYSRLYGSNPIECPNRPPADLNMANFSNYIGRIRAIIEDLSHGITQYKYVVSWEDPMLTAFSLCVFIMFCVRFNAEYSGSLPILFFIMVLIYFAVRRTQGKIKSSYIRKEVETMQKIEGNVVGDMIYRPRGAIRVSVTKGRNLLSPELGIAGNTSCKVIWDPLRFAADNQMKEHIIRSDKSADTPLEVGNTPTLYTANPDWIGMEESGIAKRLNQLFPSSENDFFEPSSTSSNDNTGIEELAFPILRPFEISGRSSCDGKLKAWESSKGAIVLQVKFQDFFNSLPGYDQVLGEVVFPFSDLVREKEVEGWFQILLDVGTTSTSPLEDHDMEAMNPPRIYIHLKWDPPLISIAGGDPDDDEKEMSHAIQEELVRSSILSKENKFNLVDSSIFAVNRALGIGGTVQVVQNTLGSILDLVEGVINLLNFTDPFKSSTIFVGLLLIWFVFVIIPTRHIVLLCGLAQYGVTFFEKYGEYLGLTKSTEPAKSTSEMNRLSALSQVDRSDEMEQKKNKSVPFIVWITNAIRSIPTNEDLRKAYFWESRQLGSEKAKKYALDKRESRLKKLWKAKWHCVMSVLVQDNEMDQRNPPTFHWELDCFAVVQGHRFIWWKSVDDFDDGEIPSGKVILSGHAGLGGPSPMELRELDKEKELPLCLTIFGRGTDRQERITILLPDKHVKEDLENAVIDSQSFKSD